MKTCASCFYQRHTQVSAWYEMTRTCLHPLSRTPVGYALSCAQAREDGKFCGPRGDAWTPQNGQPISREACRQ